MSTETPNLKLQYLDPSQAQPEVKVNDAWDKLDVVVGTIAVSDTTVSPPIVARAEEIRFTGSGVTVTHETDRVAHVQISGGGGGSGGGSPIDVMDETTEVTAVTAIRFTRGATVSVSSGSVADVYIDPVSGGGGGGYPLDFVQWYPFESGASQATTYDVIFPQTTAASGNTLFMVVAADGSNTFTAPAGWTVDINQAQSLYARFILMHKTAAADTHALLTSAAVVTFAGFFFEVAGAHVLDQSSLGGVAVQQFLALPSITPSPGAAVFGAMAYVSGLGLAYTQANEPPGSPTWKSDYIQANGAVAGRGVLLAEYLHESAGTLITPPLLNFPAWQFYVASGLAYATFSIL